MFLLEALGKRPISNSESTATRRAKSTVIRRRLVAILPSLALGASLLAACEGDDSALRTRDVFATAGAKRNDSSNQGTNTQSEAPTATFAVNPQSQPEPTSPPEPSPTPEPTPVPDLGFELTDVASIRQHYFAKWGDQCIAPDAVEAFVNPQLDPRFFGFTQPETANPLRITAAVQPYEFFRQTFPDMPEAQLKSFYFRVVVHELLHACHMGVMKDITQEFEGEYARLYTLYKDAHFDTTGVHAPGDTGPIYVDSMTLGFPFRLGEHFDYLSETLTDAVSIKVAKEEGLYNEPEHKGGYPGIARDILVRADLPMRELSDVWNRGDYFELNTIYTKMLGDYLANAGKDPSGAKEFADNFMAILLFSPSLDAANAQLQTYMDGKGY